MTRALRTIALLMLASAICLASGAIYLALATGPDPESATFACDHKPLTQAGTPDDDLAVHDKWWKFDTIATFAGDDRVLLGGNGGWPDLACTGSGNDHVQGLWGRDVVRLGAGRDSFLGGAGNDNVYGGTGADRLRLGVGSDWADAGLDNDHIWGGKGEDILIGGAGHDVGHGGPGNDVCMVDVEVAKSCTYVIEEGE